MQDILLITVDSLRADHVGYHGYEREITPNLDAFAETSHIMSNAFANGCGTSRSFPSIMTSSYPRMYGGFNPISGERQLISDILRDKGYQTAGFHSNPYLNEQFGYGRGFERFFSSETESSLLSNLRRWVKNTFDESTLVFKILKSIYALSERFAGFNPGTPFVRAEEITDEALQWAQAADSDSRFLWIHYMDVHHPYAPPEPYQLALRDESVSDRRAIQLRRKMLEEPEEITDAEFQTLIDLYDGEIKYFDHHVGRLISGIREQWGDETIIGFTSDHGDEFLDHGGFSHYDTFYDELIHVPLLFNIGDEGGEHDELVELLDLAPTLLDYADIPRPDGFLGSSLRGVFEANDWDKEGVCVEAANGRAYRTQDWKYVQTDTDKKLFNLTTDPDEQNNVLDEHPDRAKEFEERLEQYERHEQETDRTVNAPEIDGQTKDRLKDLGYLR